MEEHRMRNVLVVFGALVCIALLTALYWLYGNRSTGLTDAQVIDSLTAPPGSDHAPPDPKLIKNTSTANGSSSLPPKTDQATLESLTPTP